ncbi:MAG TPA: CPBP family intramembrane glutamic endopeptidase [Thermoanaerobaculia bacterium]|jgi:hypothetical protein
MNLFVNAQRRLRNGWWLLLFFALMAAMLIALQRVSASPWVQIAIIAAATTICQLLRRRPLTEITGRIDAQWLMQLLTGCALGAALMLAPALLLRLIGAVRWTRSDATLAAIAGAIPMVIAIALAEELLFRGFLFQRLIDGAGALAAQLIVAAWFVLTHSAALAHAGSVRWLAAINIFVASLLFGFAFLRTSRLAMPFGLHFAANFTQGKLLGFGVSGNHDAGLLVVHRGSSAEWLTGAAFGLEASLPGLVAVIAVTWLVARGRPRWIRTS